MSVNKLDAKVEYVLAFSGGVDSTVLLHQCTKAWRTGAIAKLRAVYVHHGLSANADDWREHCQAICLDLNVPFKSLTVTSKPNSGESIEAFARNARYDLLFNDLTQSEILLTAQHQNDQAETFLLQALRGSGPYGLSAMGERENLKRPFLTTEKQVILAYAKKHKLTWIEDPMNQDSALSRNYLRHHVMPLLDQHWGNVAKTLSRSAKLQAQASELLDDLAKIDLLLVEGPFAITLSISGLNKLSLVRAHHVLRFWLRQRQLPLPSMKVLQHIWRDVILSKPGANALLEYGGAPRIQCYRYRDWLFIHSADIKLQRVSAPENLKHLEARFDHRGERVKKLFQQAGVPTRYRHLLPVFYQNGVLQKNIDYDPLMRVLFD